LTGRGKRKPGKRPGRCAVNRKSIARQSKVNRLSIKRQSRRLTVNPQVFDIKRLSIDPAEKPFRQSDATRTALAAAATRTGTVNKTGTKVKRIRSAAAQQPP
jgi:hypothetical protein